MSNKFEIILWDAVIRAKLVYALESLGLQTTFINKANTNKQVFEDAKGNGLSPACFPVHKKARKDALGAYSEYAPRAMMQIDNGFNLARKLPTTYT